MADHQQDSQQWNAGLDNLDFQSNDPHSASSHPPSVSQSASASASPSAYHIPTGTTAPPTSNDPIPSSAPDTTFADLSANPPWVDPNQFTPPLDPADGALPFGAGFNFLPDNWAAVPTNTFANQPLQFRPRNDQDIPEFQPPSLDFFSPFVGGDANLATSESSRPVPRPTGAMSTLTPAQQEHLKNIAMPAHLQYQSPKSEPSQPSPQSSVGDGMKLASPDPSKPGSRKRKSSADEDDLDDEDDEDGQQPVKKTAHNMIEKRYRTNLNDKIVALRDSVPSLRVLSKSARGEDTTEDREELHGLTPAHKLNKATVLSKATEYIRHLEKRNHRLTGENAQMQERITAFEKLFVANAMNGTMSPIQNANPAMQFGQDAAPFMNTPVGTSRGMDAQGMIPVPDNMKRIIDAQMQSGQRYPVPQQPFQQNPAVMRQQQIQQQQQMQNSRWQNSGTSPYSRYFVGSLAGLMFLGLAMREEQKSNESPEGRGLFSLPLQLVGSIVSQWHVSVAGQHFSAAQLLSTLETLGVFGLLLWALVPSLFQAPAPKAQKTAIPHNTALQAVPSLASPINVRRQAWLAAIQTVWVPRHNFFLEAAALLLKTVKLSLRSAVGVHGYQMLTGLTEDQETARVKAWTIALDAQLAGGDVEINKSRLTLTLLASRTLPDTPLRLMLSALHIRVLLRELGKQGIHNALAAKLARTKWLEARQLYRLINSLRRSEQPSPDDELPDHLALLLEQECDDVLNDNIVQRAHNLAFNNPTTHDIDEDVDGMSAVVEDPAVRSPMDAVSAWWSSLVLQRALSESLTSALDKTETDNDVADDINLAIKVAPIGSNAQLRALVARAVIFDEKRAVNIAMVLKALGPSLNPDKHPHYSRGVPPLIDAPFSSITPDPDVQLALRCAMTIAHLQRYESPPRSVLLVIDSILPGSTEGLSFLGCAAAFYMMEQLQNHTVAAEACSMSLERLSGTLRIWIGSAEGDRPGLDCDLRRKVVERCLAVTKKVIGMVEDQGYATMTDCESEDDSCASDDVSFSTS